MRAFSFEQRKMPRFHRDDLPACALFLLLYAFGVSCGLASCGGEDAVRIFAALPTAFSGAQRRSSVIRVLLCSLFGTSAQSALMLLTGISVWLLPLWGIVLFARSVAVGVCAALCLAALEAHIDCAAAVTVFVSMVFLSALWYEMRLGILPIVHRRKRSEDDALYLTLGAAYALRYVLLSVVLTAAGLWVFFRMSMLD